MIKQQVTVTGEIRGHHMPQHSGVPSIHGMTVRQAITELRGVDWGNLGGTHDISLSDGTWLMVCCQRSLMSSQHIQRIDWQDSDAKVIRKYRM